MWDSPALVAACLLLAVALAAAAYRRLSKPRVDLLREWEEQGLLESTEYKATRAFQLEEWEDEGLHFFLELEDGSVLYLNGQYLYEYEEIVDDVEVPIPRRFPCTDFTVKRHRRSGDLADLICRGDAFEPETVAPPFDDAEYRRGAVPEDGQVIRDRSYDEIKRERLARAR
jgi:hypothetical protein